MSHISLAGRSIETIDQATEPITNQLGQISSQLSKIIACNMKGSR